MRSFRKDALTAHLPTSAAAPALYEEMGRKGPPPLKQFLPQLAKGKGPTQAGFRAKDVKAAGSGFPGERLQAW